MNAYSPWKAAHHRERIDRLKRGELIIPSHIQIDPIAACNHRCTYCFYRCIKDEYINSLFNENDVLDWNVLKKLLIEVKELGVASIQYTGGGEPTLYPHISELLNETIKLGFEFSYVTNGSLLTDDVIEKLKQASWVRVSMDAATRETYRKCHHANHFDLVVENIRKLKEGKGLLGYSFVINPINHSEIMEAAQLAKGLGCDNIRFSLAYTKRGHKLHEPYWGKVLASFDRAKMLETDTFKVFALKERMDNLRTTRKNYERCYYQHFVAVVGSDGRLYPCCTYKNNKRAVLGSLYENDFPTLWFEKRRKWLEHLDVQECNWCWMDSKNEFISYLVDSPQHVNFV